MPNSVLWVDDQIERVSSFHISEEQMSPFTSANTTVFFFSLFLYWLGPTLKTFLNLLILNLSKVQTLNVIIKLSHGNVKL